jgi:hypothetical protein
VNEFCIHTTARTHSTYRIKIEEWFNLMNRPRRDVKDNICTYIITVNDMKYDAEEMLVHIFDQEVMEQVHTVANHERVNIIPYLSGCTACGLWPLRDYILYGLIDVLCAFIPLYRRHKSLEVRCVIGGPKNCSEDQRYFDISIPGNIMRFNCVL